LKGRKQIFQCVIPQKSKEKLMDELNFFGINYRTLFVDLDNMSKDIMLKFKNPKWSLWGQPDEKYNPNA